MADATHHSKSRTAPAQRTLSVRLRMMILAIVAVGPLLAERIYNERLDRTERIEDAYKQALSLARQAAATQNEVIVSARVLLQSVATARETFSASNDDCNRFLTKVAASAPWVQVLSVANLQGRIQCSSFPAAIGLDISDRPHFTRAIDSGDFFVSDYFLPARTSAPVITASLAQSGWNGAASAVVVALLDLHWFGKIANNFLTPSGSMLMIDGAGTVLAQYPDSRSFVGQKLNDQPLVREMLARPEGLATETGPDGVRRLYGFVQLSNTQARFAVGFDESEIVSRANRAMWLALSEVGIVTAIVLLGIWFGGERLLVQPIRSLAQTAAGIGHGKIKTRAAGLPWATEFVPLAAALDDMADKLHAREQELRDSNSQLAELANTDALTGLANRRTFNARLASEWQTAARLQQPIAILMIDVDHFKKFNDHYGHVQGDNCLRKVADVLRAGTRTKLTTARNGKPNDMPPSFGRTGGLERRPDLAARYGGEEFAVLLQGADADLAAMVGDRLRQGVEDLLMAHAGAAWGFVSISVGVASAIPGEANTSQKLTELADAALYAAKQKGRNTVAVSTSGLPSVAAPAL